MWWIRRFTKIWKWISLIFIVKFQLICLRFKVEDKPLEIEQINWFEYICSLSPISNLYVIIASFDDSPSTSSNIIKNADVEVHINHDEVVSTMYDKLLNLVHTSYSVNDNHVDEPLSQIFQEFDKNYKKKSQINLKDHLPRNMKITMN